MKPATLMTMHRSKGEEFDDYYLAGWTEGEFPHPDAVSSNRVHEERRLAYVALPRSRQRVVLTHAFMSRVLHFRKDGGKRCVTSQDKLSLFVYELMPSKRALAGITNNDVDVGDCSWLPPSSSDSKGTVWERDLGYKEWVAGENLPDFFQKSYQNPNGYTSKGQIFV